MAKKRRKDRRPIAPPVHSAPETLQRPPGPSAEAPQSRPFAPEPPQAHVEPEAVGRTETPRRPAPQRRRPARRRRGPSRGWLVFLAAVVFLAVIFIGQSLLSRRAANQFASLARANGCSDVRNTGASGAAQHLRPGETTRYDTSPPTHGTHDPSTLGAGIYNEPLSTKPGDAASVYKAVHSLEHGGVVIWYDRLSSDDRRALERRYRNENKVIVAPYPALKGKTHVAMSAWGRLVTCEGLSTEVVDAFIDRYREARTAPEPKNAI